MGVRERIVIPIEISGKQLQDQEAEEEEDANYY